jgi:hypothetical protein
MTPNYWHSEPSTWERLQGMGGTRVAVSFTILEFLSPLSSFGPVS